jgi:hypothetical protein
MMICPSKCRPFNSASTGTNDCILPSSPIAACLHQNAGEHLHDYQGRDLVFWEMLKKSRARLLRARPVLERLHKESILMRLFGKL